MTELRVSSTNPDVVEDAAQFWGDLLTSILSLFLSTTGGINWVSLVGPLREAGAFYFAVFLVYISFHVFAVLNVITGVFCQSAIDSAQQDHDHVISQVEETRQAYAICRFCLVCIQS